MVVEPLRDLENWKFVIITDFEFFLELLAIFSVFCYSHDIRLLSRWW
jgi:hypothetical protein